MRALASLEGKLVVVVVGPTASTPVAPDGPERTGRTNGGLQPALPRPHALAGQGETLGPANHRWQERITSR